MAFYDDIKAAAAALHRLSQAEKALLQQSAATEGAIGSIRRDLADLRDRMIRIEARFDAFEELTVARMQAVAGTAIATAIAAMARQAAQPAPAAPIGSTAIAPRRRRKRKDPE